MKKRIIALLALVTMLVPAQVFAQETTEDRIPKIFVDERELSFADQQPVIVAETGRTLIPLRFVLESAGAKVKWDGEARTVTVDSGDNRNRVVLTIDSDEMKMFFFPSVRDSVTDVVKLDQKPVIMNDRTMIPVRAVLEAIGARVDWDEESYVINVTSRAYTRYLRDMGVEGYEVNYPLLEGEASFDLPKEREEATPYSAKDELVALSLTADNNKAAVGETVDVYVRLDNIDMLEEGSFLSTMSATLKYDMEKLVYSGYALVNGETEYSSVMDAANPNFLEDSVKIATIANLGLEETPAVTEGNIMKVTFKVVKEGAAEISLSSRVHSMFSVDTSISFKNDKTTTSFQEANELYIDSTPVVINPAE